MVESRPSKPLVAGSSPVSRSLLLYDCYDANKSLSSVRPGEREMTAVVQRVSRAEVSVDSRTISRISEGLLILLGIRKGDTIDQVERLAQRCVNLRIFEDLHGKFNFSLKDVKGEALVVSQFTLLADTARGRRPSFSAAETPERSRDLYEKFIEIINKCGIPARGGVFGSRMLVSLDNNGPVTIIMEE